MAGAGDEPSAELVPAAAGCAAWSASCRCPAIGSVCEWKGPAVYYDIVVPPHGAHPGGVARKAAWAYPRPTPAFAPIAGHIALYPG